MSHDLCIICRTRGHKMKRAGWGPLLRCVEEDACNRRCVAQAWARQFQERRMPQATEESK